MIGVDLSIPAVAVRGRLLPFPGASAGMNFVTNKYQLGGAAFTSPTAIPGWSFTRASTGYAQTVAGTWTSFGSGVVRITDKGMLIEEARTNLCPNSATVGSTGWLAITSATATTGLPNPVTGLSTMSRLTSGGSSASSRFQSSSAITISAGVTYTLSAIIKKDTSTTIAFAVWNGAVGAMLGTAQVSFDSAGTPTASSMSGTATGLAFTQLADGFWRASFSVSSGVETDCKILIYPDQLGTNLSFFCDAVQLEAGAFPTSYIPTAGSTATRAADIPDLISSITLPAAYTIFAEAEVQPSRIGGFPSFVGFPGSVGLFVNGTTGAPGANMGGATYNAAYGGTVPNTTLGGIVKSAFRAETNNANGSSGGGLGVVDASFTPTTGLLSHFYPGLSSSTGAPYNGYLRRALVYTVAMTDAQLQAVTT